MSEPSGEQDWLSRVDPALARVVPLLPAGDLSDVAAERAELHQLIEGVEVSVPGPDQLEITDHEVPGLGDAPPVPVRRYRPTTNPEAGHPGLLWLHGGGFVLGDIEMEHAEAAHLAVALDAVVVSPGYRLAPEHPFPAALDDCMAALHWLSIGAAAHGVNSQRIAVGGVSAGGGLSAALALRARDEGGPALCFQFLAIPDLDDRLETPSMREFVDTPMWNRRLAERSWQYYLGDGPRDEVSPYAAPARATDLRGLPPAYVSTAELDPLRDEGILYALGLLQAGVSVELHQFPGAFHGSQLVMHADVSKRASREMFTVLQRAFGS